MFYRYSLMDAELPFLKCYSRSNTHLNNVVDVIHSFIYSFIHSNNYTINLAEDSPDMKWIFFRAQLEHIGAHWSTLEHIGAHWSTLEHIGAHWSTLEHIGAHWSTLEHIGAHWSTLEHIGAHWSTLEHIGAQVICFGKELNTQYVKCSPISTITAPPRDDICTAAARLISLTYLWAFPRGQSLAHCYLVSISITWFQQ